MKTLLLACTLLMACGSNLDLASDEAALSPLAAETYLTAGTRRVTVTTSRPRVSNCNLEVGSYVPDNVRSQSVLVIAPGFNMLGIGSSRANLDTLARHVASWGLRTHTVSLCTNGAGIDHPRNAAVLAAYGESLSVPVLYAGFSAGGLAALTASATATRSEGYLALDAVDANALADSALASLDVPAYALLGEASSCNSQSNMAAQYTGLAVRVLKVNRAQHFLFEGAVCRGFRCLLCNGGGENEAQAIRALTTAFALGVSGASDTALDWWDGSELSSLISRGIVQSVQ